MRLVAKRNWRPSARHGLRHGATPVCKAAMMRSVTMSATDDVMAITPMGTGLADAGAVEGVDADVAEGVGLLAVGELQGEVEAAVPAEDSPHRLGAVALVARVEV